MSKSKQDRIMDLEGRADSLATAEGLILEGKEYLEELKGTGKITRKLESLLEWFEDEYIRIGEDIENIELEVVE